MVGPNNEQPSKAGEGTRPEILEQESSAPPPEAAFEPVSEPGSASPQSQAAGGRTAMPEAAVSPRQPTAQASAAQAPWLPPELGARLALPAALLMIPVAAALAAQWWLGRTHVIHDDTLLLSDGGADEVTAMQWSADGALHVGTRQGGTHRIPADSTVDETLPPNGSGPVQSFHPLRAGQAPIPVIQNHLSREVVNLTAGWTISGFTPTETGPLDIEGGLFAVLGANNGSAVVGRALAGGGQDLNIPSNNLLNTYNQPAPQQQQQQQQQQQFQLPGEDETPDPFLITEPASGPPRFGLSLFRDFQTGSPTEVGQIFGIEDVRAIAALPGSDTVVAGDGAGNVFAIDASQQISGASPETYIRGIGQHEAAIVEIVAAAQPADDGVLFVTRAEDRTIKVWRGSVSRGSQLIPLGDYPNTDVTIPGSTWLREPITFANPRSRATDVNLTELLAMTADGRRILARRANTDLILLDLPAQGEEGEATEFGDTSYITPDSPAMLSGDGSRLIIAEATNFAVEMYELSGVESGQASRLAVTSFPGLAGIQFLRFAFDRRGQRFVAIATDGSVYVQTVATPEVVTALRQYRGTDPEAAISPDGSLVAVSELSGQVIIHSAEDGRELAVLDGPPDTGQLGFQDGSKGVISGLPQKLGQLAFDQSGKRLRASTIDTLRVYTYSLRNPRSTIYEFGQVADGAPEGFFPNGSRYLKRDGEAGYTIVDLDSGSDVGRLQAAANATGWVSNLDGSRIAMLGGSGNLSVFREMESATANGPMPAIADNAMRLSADGRTLVVGSRNGELSLARLDGDGGEAGYRLRPLSLPRPALQYEVSPDGSSVVTSEADGTVAVSDLTSSSETPANQSQAQGAGREPADGVIAANTVEISGHGAPLTAMALSPDGERLATASIDGRLRITSIAWARLVHSIPLASLPSGPERAKLEPQPLDDSPYALMSGATSSDFGDGEPSGQPFIVVYNARKSLGQAQGARIRAAEAGFPDGQIYRRQGFFRGIFAFATEEARDAALPRIQQAFSGAYARDVRSWCRSALPQQDFIDCDAVVAGAEPPPAMAN
jgi:WD40 repeat protein